MTITASPQASLRWRDLRRSSKLFVLAFVCLLLFGGLELAARVYWSAARGVPPTHPDRIWRSFFPELAEGKIDSVAPNHGDNSFDVLLLGGSVLHPEWGDVGERLQTALTAKLGRKVRVVNLASPGRVTLDSLVKYEHLTDKRFDLVLVYEGINDIKLNNTPPGNFRADYSHHSRYAQLNHLRGDREPRYLMMPFTVHYLATSLLEKSGLKERPGPQDEAQGKTVNTAPTFEANLEAIAAIAKKRGDHLMLLTFANRIPENYNEPAFVQKQLGYGDGAGAPVCMWGTPENVKRALEIHNEATRRVAARHPEAMLLDQEKLMTKEGSYFVDPCHLTAKGRERFVENVVAKDCSWLDSGYRK